MTAKSPFTTCQQPGCDRPFAARERCGTHYAEWRRRRAGRLPQRYGPEHHNWNPDIGYRSLHHRLERTRGNANTHPCVDCGQPAREWSLRHDALHVVIDHNARVFSRDLADYEARCAACHKAYDFAALKLSG